LRREDEEKKECNEMMFKPINHTLLLYTSSIQLSMMDKGNRCGHDSNIIKELLHNDCTSNLFIHGCSEHPISRFHILLHHINSLCLALRLREL
jgi:hypothetical protein